MEFVQHIRGQRQHAVPVPTHCKSFKVETSSLTAQKGVHAAGHHGRHKSGTNAFHGDASSSSATAI